MRITAEESKSIFQELSQKVNEPCDAFGFRQMAVRIGGDVSDRFLSDKYRESNASIEGVNYQNSKLDLILKALGYQNMREFQEYLSNPIPEVLKSCLGTWVSYVRQNSQDGIIYQSPVEIFEKGQKAFFKLRGPKTTYSGKITYSNGCLTTLFSGTSGKTFHHIYKIGNRLDPKVLQGIYSGISTADDPIGGRAVLSRSNEQFDQIENIEMKIQELGKSDNELHKSLASYFDGFEKNNLRLNTIISFSAQDLK